MLSMIQGMVGNMVASSGMNMEQFCLVLILSLFGIMIIGLATDRKSVV